jgi:hypothetical protein
VPTIALRIAPLLLGLLAQPEAGADGPNAGTVIVDSLDAFVADNPAAIIAESFHRGEQVRVLEQNKKTGWLTVAPAASAFAWIERDAVDENGGHAQVSVPTAVTRIGIAGARLAGPQGPALERGAEVCLLDRPTLTLPGPSGTAIVWLAIAPPERSVRYVQVEGVQLARPASAPIESPRETRAAFLEDVQDGASSLPPELAAEVARVEAEHRAAMSGPVDTWRLEPIRSRLEFLLKKAMTPEAVATIQGKLNVLEKHDAIARSARSFRTVLESSRRRDQRAARAAKKLSDVDLPQNEPFALQGLLQPSSRQIEGRRVFALIGSQGAPIAYLDVPPGLDVHRMLAKQVGVHGSTRYSETLRARLITVRDLEPLE